MMSSFVLELVVGLVCWWFFFVLGCFFFGGGVSRECWCFVWVLFFFFHIKFLMKVKQGQEASNKQDMEWDKMKEERGSQFLKKKNKNLFVHLFFLPLHLFSLQSSSPDTRHIQMLQHSEQKDICGAQTMGEGLARPKKKERKHDQK